MIPEVISTSAVGHHLPTRGLTSLPRALYLTAQRPYQALFAQLGDGVAEADREAELEAAALADTFAPRVAVRGPMNRVWPHGVEGTVVQPWKYWPRRPCPVPLDKT